MTRPRRSSGASDDSVGTVREQELGSMYDYLAKIILLGPSGTGKSCLLHRFVKNEWRVLSSQTIGVEFASKIIKVGTGSRRKRIKLQLWDTAGTERFRSVSRSYYRGAAGAILVYDLTSHVSFNAIQPFLNDARALASPQLSLLLVGNKLDLAIEMPDTGAPSSTVPSSYASTSTMQAGDYPSYSTSTITSSGSASIATQASTLRATIAPEGREVSTAVANRWASQVGVPVVMEASALSGDQVDEVFERLARMIVTKIEIGDIDPDDPLSGIQYGDGYGYSAASIRGDGASVKNPLNGVTVDDGSAIFYELFGTDIMTQRIDPQRCLTRRIRLDSHWTFKQGQDATSCHHPDVAPDWLPVAQFPTNIHLDLLHHGLISDPFTSKNESLVQWVGETSWIYRTTFDLPGDKGRPGLDPMSDATADAAVCADLLFHGLDTVASVSLNGIEILHADNMFVPHRICVRQHLLWDKKNELVVNFESALLVGRARVLRQPQHKWGCWNGENSRLAVRKAQYHWGWDWGPMLMTCGLWRPVELHVGCVYITDLSAQININLKSISASVDIATETKGVSSVLSQTSIHVTLALDDYHQTKVVSHGESAHFEPPYPRLWYPAKYGPQPLYTVTVLVMDDKGHIYDRQEKRIGLRKIELNQESLQGQQGTSFFFRVNGIPVFCGGSNWIPADSFLPILNSNKYHAWMKLLRDGNQVMVRVWGGGVYEDDTFYDACDELGILVWQDFMFACGNYPASPEILKSVESEARANVIRLRHHPSIVIWAGNNEDYQYQESEGLTYDPDNKDPQSWLKTDFPARYIYEHLLPRVCAELIPQTAYHFGSPWGGKNSGDSTVGDIHQWNVWHGTQERYQDFDKLVGRFVSEFGMEAFPSTKTIDSFLPRGKDDPDRYAQSSTLDFHNKATGHERRLALYLVENLRYALDPLEAYVYATQLMQAECLSYAYRLFKRQWQGPGKEYCAGALVWQLNDCWPVTSWSICDYYLRPKLAYYAIKREMAALSVGASRKEGEQNRKVQVWACNLALEHAEVDLEVKGIHVETGAELFKPVRIGSMVLRRNRSTELLALDIEVQQSEDANSTIVAVYLQQDGKRVARHINWPEPLKYLHLQQPKDLRVTLSADYKSVVVSADVPVKGVALECEDEGVVFEDNCIDVVPDEKVVLGLHGATASTIITARYLGMK
ncbi:hypothetical protein Cpir12675_001911 [Ceratocystis pirilliformis]|uniref:Beta-mannosidase B n=1 Tax=Ceratocystis pirilliformis TaxID=259994 RepID=A0ABR3ZCF8_9PEZI